MKQSIKNKARVLILNENSRITQGNIFGPLSTCKIINNGYKAAGNALKIPAHLGPNTAARPVINKIMIPAAIPRIAILPRPLVVLPAWAVPLTILWTHIRLPEKTARKQTSDNGRLSFKLLIKLPALKIEASQQCRPSIRIKNAGRFSGRPTNRRHKIQVRRQARRYPRESLGS